MLPVPRTWSEVTPSWMTSALSARLPTAVVDAVDIGPVADGTNSRARVALTYSEGHGPSSVFVKRAGRIGHRVALAVLGALATEARLASSGVDLPLEHPRPYAGGVDWARLAAAVVMDDVAIAGGRPNDARTPLGVGTVRSGLEGLARLHAAHWGGRMPAALGFLRPWHLGPGWAAVSVASLARGLRRLGTLAPRPAPRPWTDARTLGRQFARSAVLAASGDQTLLHGDAHPGNSYALPGGRTGFLDWQLARTGNWSHDVGYFLVGSLAVADRRANEQALLGAYLESLGRAGAPSPDWDRAWARYRATPAFGLATWLHTLSFGTLQPVEVCLTTIYRFAAAYDDLETGRSLVSGPA